MKTKYYIVDGSVLPDVFIKVTEAKALLETGAAATVADAVASVGLSRSAFYKYRDSISPFKDIKRGQIITFQMLLHDRLGVLSNVLSAFADSGANILTINQSIPVNSTAAVNISAETANMRLTTEEFMSSIAAVDGVIKIEITAG